MGKADMEGELSGRAKGGGMAETWRGESKGQERAGVAGLVSGAY